MKYNVLVYNDKLPDGKSGYRIETHINYSVGVKERRETIKNVLVTDTFIFKSSEATRSVQDQVLVSSLIREGNEMIISSGPQGGEIKSERVPIEGPVFEIHPMLYAHDLTAPGSEKRYPIFYEQTRSVKQLLVRYVEDTKIKSGNQSISCKHFQIEEAKTPGTFSDFYLDTNTNEPVYIKLATFEFKRDED